jgi:hypothetical protein
MSGYHFLSFVVGLVGLWWIDQLVRGGFFPTTRADRIARVTAWLWFVLWSGPPLVILWVKSVTS